MTRFRTLFLLAVFGFCFFLMGNGNFSLFDNSEAHYARVSQEMAQSHDYLTLTFNGEPWFVHPPLYFWLTNVTAPLFNWNVFGLRLWEGIFGILGLFVTYLIGEFFFSRQVAFLGSLILGSSLYYIVISRLAIFDTLFNTFILGSIFCLLIGIYHSRRRVFAFSGAAILTALAVLTKGPFGLIHPALVIIPFVIWKKQWKLFYDKSLFIYLGIVLALTSPWYAHQLMLHGQAFFDIALKDYTWYRFFGVVESQTGPWYFYFIVLCGFIPWFIYLPDIWRQRALGKEKEGIVFCWMTIFVTFLFFTVSKTKLPSYIILIFPFLSLLIAKYLLESTSRLKNKLSVVIWAIFACATVGSLFVQLDPYFAQSRYFITVFFGAFLIAVSGLVYFGVVKKQWGNAIKAYAVGLVFVCVYLGYFFFPKVESYMDPYLMSQSLKDKEKPYQLVMWDVFSPHIMFHLNTNYTSAHTQEEFVKIMSESSVKTYAIISNGHLSELDNLKVRYVILKKGRDMSSVKVL